MNEAIEGVIRFSVIQAYLKREKQGLGRNNYEYWYSVMNEAEKKALCSYFKCHNTATKGCLRHNP